MILSSVLLAIGLFIATNIDDIIVLSLFFARGAGQRGTTARITAGQYLGFAGILGAAVLVSVGAGAFLPEEAIPYFGLIPLALGLWAAWRAWRGGDDDDDDAKVEGKNVGVFTDGGLRRGIEKEGNKFLAKKLSTLKFNAPFTISPEALLDEAQKAFKEHKVDTLSVSENGKPLGMLDIQDLMKAIAG